MSASLTNPVRTAKEARAAVLLVEHEQQIYRRTDRLFAALLFAQWLAGIVAAIWISPRAWAGSASYVHPNIYASILLGGLVSGLPIALALLRPGEAVTRHVIAIGQMLTSALLIHLTGGRIETHFHVFGSLAFLAFYRDWRVLMTASVVVALDHVLRGIFWPPSVYGVLATEPWRWLEHAGWVAFEDAFLLISIAHGRREMCAIAERQADLEWTNGEIEAQVQARTVQLADSEAALRVALEEAKESERMKGEFLASMSHEIRTPLNGVIGMTGLLLDSDLDSDQREFAEMLRSSGEGLLTIINDVLDFSKIEAGQLAIEPVPFDLQIATEEVLQLLAPRAAEKQVSLVLRYPPSAPHRLVGDPGRIRQVLMNLVGNAIKFTEKGHVLVEAEFKQSDPARAFVCFRVQDTGIGIPDDKIDHVFGRFTQADASTTRKYGGTGLGLAISKQLVELMGGRIGVKSDVGRGSTFWFELTLPFDDNRTQSGGLASPELQNVRVLIVDDNAVNRRILHELITRWGMRNGGFASGAEALVALHEAYSQGDPYQIALLDMSMPGMDGEMLGRAIKTDPELHDTVLILATSSAQLGEAKRVAAAGFAGYLMKPVRPSVLQRALAAAWSRRHLDGPAVLFSRHDQGDGIDAQPAQPRDGGAVRALVVEDNAVNQRLARAMLERLGCRVDLAANGLEAVRMVEMMSYDIVFMDCQMPEMNGYDATREIRRDARWADLPIVAMTASAMEGDRDTCLAIGMSDYISKPVSRADLAAALDRWVASRAAVLPASVA